MGFLDAVQGAISGTYNFGKKAVKGTVSLVEGGVIAATNMAERQSDKLKAGLALRTPEEKQHAYDIARQSMLGDFIPGPITACQECMASDKAQRRQARLDLVNTALVSNPQFTLEAERLRRDMDEVEYMRCAKHVYLANDPDAPADLKKPPPGFTMASDEQLKQMQLEQDLLTPEGTQFKAAVYMKDPAVWGPDSRPAAVLAFRGSTEEEEDWVNNYAQGANRKSSYYRRAVEIGNQLVDSEISTLIVGHSLGGGLASAAQGGSGLNASTYNAAGLHADTVANYSENAAHMQAEDDKIAAYRIKGEVVTTSQESGMSSMIAPTAVGIKHDLEPAHDEAYFQENDKVKADKNDTYDTYLHGMDQVIATTETQKKADEQVLKSGLRK